MKPLPHYYNVTVTANGEAPSEITSPGLKRIVSAPPTEFGGPGNLWSPETMTVAAVTNCFVLTFHAISMASNLKWTNLVCDGQGTVDRSDGVLRFTAIQLRARLLLPPDGDEEKARRLLEKTESACLVGNSLKFVPALEIEVALEDPALVPTA